MDDATRFRSVTLLKAKSETFSAFKQFKAFAENQTGEKIGALRDDKGGEYMSNEMEAFCIEQGIERQHTVRNRPQQNGVAERFNRTLAEGLTAMLAESGLPSSFWGEAHSSLVHVLNRCPTSALPGKTPFEVFHGQHPDVSHLHIWGLCACANRQMGSLEFTHGESDLYWLSSWLQALKVLQSTHQEGSDLCKSYPSCMVFLWSQELV